jgi:DNA-binding CsgD family transcriptional regulator
MASYFRDTIPIPHEVRVPRYGPGSPYAMSVIPLTNSGDRAVLPDGAGCLVLLYDLEVANPLPVDRLAWLYRLTPAESRVCEPLFRAGSVDAVAVDLSLTRNTVRSHLKNIYAKFGVVSQGQLMQRLANSLRLTEGGRDKGPPNSQN